MLDDNEQQLVQAISGYLAEEMELGLGLDDEDTDGERGFQHLHSQIHDMFSNKTAELTHSTAINAAFAKVHGYKYIDDDTFCNALNKELTAQGIPANEREKACGFIESIIKQLRNEGQQWAEKDSGFNPNLDEVMDINVDDPELEQLDTDFNMESNVDLETE